MCLTDSPDTLRNDVEESFEQADSARCDAAGRDRGVQVAAAHGASKVDTGQDNETESQTEQQQKRRERFLRHISFSHCKKKGISKGKNRVDATKQICHWTMQYECYMLLIITVLLAIVLVLYVLVPVYAIAEN